MHSPCGRKRQAHLPDQGGERGKGNPQSMGNSRAVFGKPRLLDKLERKGEEFTVGKKPPWKGQKKRRKLWLNHKRGPKTGYQGRLNFKYGNGSGTQKNREIGEPTKNLAIGGKRGWGKIRGLNKC